MSAISGIPVDTLRARARRNSSCAALNPLEGFDTHSNGSVFKRIRPLNELVLPGITNLQIDQRTRQLNEALSCSIYTAAKLLQVEDDVALLSSQISLSDRERIDRGLTRMANALGSSLKASHEISLSKVVGSELFESLSESFSGLNPTLDKALIISRVISSPSKPWGIFDETNLTIVAELFDPLDTDQIDIDISRSKGKSYDLNTFLALPSSRFTHRAIDQRWFPSGCLYRFQFVPRNTTREAFPSKSPETTFFISSIVISRCALTLGENS